MNCPLCNAELRLWPPVLVSCRGTVRTAPHRFYIKWNDDVSAGDPNDRILELAVPDADTPRGTTWPVPNDATFPNQ